VAACPACFDVVAVTHDVTMCNLWMKVWHLPAQYISMGAARKDLGLCLNVGSKV
jgi:hypothetical protein